MGAMFRSEEMALCQLFIQPEVAYPAVAALGEIGVVQFRDLNEDVNAFQRKFVNEVRRCDEMERKLRYIEAEIIKDKVVIPEATIPAHSPNPREMSELESSLEFNENQIKDLTNNAISLKHEYLTLLEVKHLLEKTQNFFQENVYFQQQENNTVGDSLTKALINEEAGQGTRGRLGFVAGVIQRERVPGFERMLWRVSRGNIFLRQAEIEEPLEDPHTGNEIYKTVFVAFFQGEQLKNIIKKICSGFHATFYPCPCSSEERTKSYKSLSNDVDDLSLVLEQTYAHRRRVLTSVAQQLHQWSIQVRKMKATYYMLNLFNMDVTKKCLIAECWVPSNDIKQVREVLAIGAKEVGSSIPSFLNVIEPAEPPPTFNRTNKFTRAFQMLIDAYGIASYREVNPALYTIITFPFLFGIMFGDAGHGVILLAFATYLVVYEKKLMAKKTTNEIWNIFFGGRYIILMMGLFSIYTGLIYNDVFSKSINLFGSYWNAKIYNASTITSNEHLILNPSSSDYVQVPYPFGLDPVWQLATGNKIIFMNSFKMKLSIIFGVLHMIFGVTLSVVNHVQFNKKIYILFEFLPQVLFLVCLFFYMVALMFMKWVLYGPTNELEWGPSCAPSVLISFINMVLFKTADKNSNDDCDPYMFRNQYIVQISLMVVALLCIPVLLFAKPIYILWFEKKNVPTHNVINGDINQGVELQPLEDEGKSSGTTEITIEQVVPEQKHNEHDEPPFEMFIQQSIHTIEYVLSTVSHTASYLRLWALSLAHAQLSEVLWNMVLKAGLQGESNWAAIGLFLAFGAWSFLTLAILVMMEGLSAFLHTLRLHWVEFMSKFYVGTGYAFLPFSFKKILESQDFNEDD